MFPFTTSFRPRRRAPASGALDRAIGWIEAHQAPGGGIVPHHRHAIGSQEVTGYLIPTLAAAGRTDFACALARWEASVQRADGAFAAVDGVPYTFDTAQVVRGFLAVLESLPALEGGLRRACDFIARQIGPEGKVHTPSYAQWACPDGSTFSEYANLYVLPPLAAAGRRLGEPAYEEAASRALEYYRRRTDLIEFRPNMGTLSHIFGYMMEALVELGEHDLARRGLAQASVIQRADGAVPAYPGAPWICTTGVAQLAVAWYRLGESVPADRAVAYLKKIQRPSGGFYGSVGPGAAYFPGREISWAVKYFIDGLLLQATVDGGRLAAGRDEEVALCRSHGI